MNREAIRLLHEAQRLAAERGTELARFNAERAQILAGVPPVPGERMPLPSTGVGGDVGDEL